MSTSSCATCATRYDSPLDLLSEKPLLPGRILECCGRSICSKCLGQNKRYETYCPYCQITSAPSLLPQGLRDPPAYSPHDDQIALPPAPSLEGSDDLPAYTANSSIHANDEKRTDEPAEDVLHFLNTGDSMQSLSLAYGVPINILRKVNNVYSDHLLQGRKTVLIPGEYYKGGVSLSPQPIESEEEEIQKTRIRRWMVTCKVAEYDVAVLYLKQNDWHLETAIEAYKEDERWEREHPLEAKGRGPGRGKSVKSTGMRRFIGSSGS